MHPLRLLADQGCSILAAGDEDQSIYSFRKAAPEGIRRFAADYPGAAIYPLTITRRCGRRIVTWARSVIERDPDRNPNRPPLRAADDAEDCEVALLAFNTSQQEGQGVADLIEHLIKDEQLPPGEILVLSRGDRAGLFSGPIKEELGKRGIPVSDPSVVQQALEGRDNRRSLEVLRLLVRHDDPLAWAALCHLTNGVGDTFVDYIYAAAAGARRGFGSTLLELWPQGFPGGPTSSRRMIPVITDVIAWLDAHPLPDEPPEDGWGAWIVSGRLQSPFSRSWLTGLAAFAQVLAVRLFPLPAAWLVWSRRCFGMVSGGCRGEGCEAEELEGKPVGVAAAGAELGGDARDSEEAEGAGDGVADGGEGLAGGGGAAAVLPECGITDIVMHFY